MNNKLHFMIINNKLHFQAVTAMPLRLIIMCWPSAERWRHALDTVQCTAGAGGLEFAIGGQVYTGN
jgi:hypothetical protein